MSSIKKCENTFCKEYTKKVVEKAKNMVKFLMTEYKNKIQQLDDETKNKFKLNNKSINDKLKDKKLINQIKKLCKEAFCNPSCKGTIFQNNEFPKELEKKIEKKFKKTLKENDIKEIIKSLKEMRNTLFKGKKTILKDNFYINLKNVNKLKKEGALSGCTLKLIDDVNPNFIKKIL